MGYSIINCSKWEATTTGFPSSRPFITISFCTEGTSSTSICAPANTRTWHNRFQPTRICGNICKVRHNTVLSNFIQFQHPVYCEDFMWFFNVQTLFWHCELCAKDHCSVVARCHTDLSSCSFMFQIQILFHVQGCQIPARQTETTTVHTGEHIYLACLFILYFDIHLWIVVCAVNDAYLCSWCTAMV